MSVSSLCTKISPNVLFWSAAMSCWWYYREPASAQYWLGGVATVFSPLQVHVLCCHSKWIRKKILRCSGHRVYQRPETFCSSSVLARILLPCLRCNTPPLGLRGSDSSLGEFSCCPSLCTVNVYASTSIWILNRKAQQKLQVIYSRGRPGIRPLRWPPLHIHKARKRSSNGHRVGNHLTFTCLLIALTLGRVLTLHEQSQIMAESKVGLVMGHQLAS